MASLSRYVDSLGFGWAQMEMCWSGGGVWLADGAELLLISSITRVVSKEWDLGPMERGLIVSIVFIGVAIGNVVGGSAGDKFGRRNPILVSYFLIFLFSVLSALSTSITVLAVFRFLVGVAFGCGQPAMNTLGAEVVPSTHRILIVATGQLLFTAGELYSALLIAYDDIEMKHLDWRWLVCMGALPSAIMGVYAYYVLIESPRWLLITKRDKAGAEAIVEGMRKQNAISKTKPWCFIQTMDASPTSRGSPQNNAIAVSNPSIWTEKITLQLEDESKKSAKQKDDEGSELVKLAKSLSPPYRTQTLMLCWSTFTLNFCFYGGLYSFPQVLSSLGDNLVVRPGISLILAALFEIPGTILGLILGLQFRRKAAIIIYAVLFVITTSMFMGGVSLSPTTVSKIVVERQTTTSGKVIPTPDEMEESFSSHEMTEPHQSSDHSSVVPTFKDIQKTVQKTLKTTGIKEATTGIKEAVNSYDTADDSSSSDSSSPVADHNDFSFEDFPENDGFHYVPNENWDAENEGMTDQDVRNAIYNVLSFGGGRDYGDLHRKNAAKISEEPFPKESWESSPKESDAEEHLSEGKLSFDASNQISNQIKKHQIKTVLNMTSISSGVGVPSTSLAAGATDSFLLDGASSKSSVSSNSKSHSRKYVVQRIRSSMTSLECPIPPQSIFGYDFRSDFVLPNKRQYSFLQERRSKRYLSKQERMRQQKLSRTRALTKMTGMSRLQKKQEALLSMFQSEKQESLSEQKHQQLSKQEPTATDAGKKSSSWIDMESLLQLGLFGNKASIQLGFAIVYLYSLESYPTEFRATGAALSIATGRLGAITCPLIYEWVSSHLNPLYFFLIMMTIMILQAVIVVCTPLVETAGKPLMEHGMINTENYKQVSLFSTIKNEVTIPTTGNV